MAGAITDDNQWLVASGDDGHVARGSSPPPIRRAGASSETCTTAPSSGWYFWCCNCARRRRSRRPSSARLAPTSTAVAEASGALDELREIARGIHPAILAKGGLRPALKALAHRSPIPIELELRGEARLPEHIEVSV
ncbi:MAG: hypothetical protein QOC90_953 [Mycobacterium sp.]|jgi:hypothetical protein|nr:hypothetical protein [Mycobacterium sp.]